MRSEGQITKKKHTFLDLQIFRWFKRCFISQRFLILKILRAFLFVKNVDTFRKLCEKDFSTIFQRISRILKRVKVLQHFQILLEIFADFSRKCTRYFLKRVSAFTIISLSRKMRHKPKIGGLYHYSV